MTEGRVKWFSQHIGAGFIKTDDGKNVFFHISSVEGIRPRTLRTGQRVSVDIVKSQSGMTLSAATVKNLEFSW
jgi:cold shock protein